MASSEPPRTIDRATLVRTVSGLSPSDFARVAVFIEGAAEQISHHGPVPEQAAELFRWVESSTGPGLEAVQRAVKQLKEGEPKGHSRPGESAGHPSPEDDAVSQGPGLVAATIGFILIFSSILSLFLLLSFIYF